MVASSWKGHEYIRPYVKPRDANTDDQREQRELFAEAVEGWQQLSAAQQAFYDAFADGMSGYNLFIQRYLDAVRDERDPELPIPMRWRTADGQPVEHAKLLVMHGSRQIFNDSLKDAFGEIALTVSDSPYTFVLKKGAVEDAVLVIKNLGETDVPAVIESKVLGIKLVADVAPIPGVPLHPNTTTTPTRREG